MSGLPASLSHEKSRLTGTAIIVNDQLYFEGGLHTFDEGNIASLEPELFWLDLNASFPVDTIISESILHSDRVPGLQWQGQGAFFTDIDLTTIYSFGGFNEWDDQFQSTVETFITTSQIWANSTIGGGAFNNRDRSFSASATTATSGLGLSFTSGGFNPDNPKGMIRFDVSSPISPTWRNETKGVPPLVGATMQYARFGDQGVLIAVGGYKDVRPDVRIFK
ncbi:MAG: hypothetical protein Q9164_005258 [Protoblastenia rupestris]